VLEKADKSVEFSILINIVVYFSLSFIFYNVNTHYTTTAMKSTNLRQNLTGRTKIEYYYLVNKPSAPTRYVLESFIPYTKANLLLTFKPSLFFHELEKKSGQKRRSLESAYYRLIDKGLIERDHEGIPRLTDLGRKRAKIYKPTRLKFGAHLLVVFDIPENERRKRRRLRILLQELSFRQIQQSVWETQYDHRDYLRLEISEMNLEEYVRVYEAAHIEL
jgi:Mn-dependent DtxR family transcriptional regulator